MKVGILTHYDVNNQGAQLQLYATYHWLQDQGHEPIVLTYRKNYDFVPELEQRNQIRLSSVPYILRNFLLEKGVGLTWHNMGKYLINKRFRHRHFRFGSYCLTDVDAALVGADEVFSLELGVNMMMYGHGVNTDRMIAYAPSFGQTDQARIDHFHCRQLIASGLQRFSALSARDERTRDIMESLTGRKVSIVCDPVLLYEFPLTELPFPKGTPHRDYMVVYSYDARFTSTADREAIRTFARSHGLRTISVGTYHDWCDVNIACNALEWLRCFSGARCVVTDTFHGTIAAAITRRPVALYYSPEVNSSKMLDLIHRLDLDRRLLKEVSTAELERVFSEPQDMNRLDENIRRFREVSREYLLQSLNQKS